MKSCTCHPDDKPPVPCAQRYALADCRKAAREQAIDEAVRRVNPYLLRGGTDLGADDDNWVRDEYLSRLLSAKEWAAINTEFRRIMSEPKPGSIVWRDPAKMMADMLDEQYERAVAHLK